MLVTLLSLIKQNFKSDAEFERKFNLKPKTLYDWKRGKSSSYKNMLVDLSTYFNVSTDYLLGKTEDPAATNDSDVSGLQRRQQKYPSNTFPAETEYIRIPLLGNVAAGLGCLAENEIVDYEPWSASSIKYGHEYICLKVTGDSMYPILIEDDLILVQCQRSVDSGSLAVLTVNGDEGVVKKVTYGDDWIELHSINPMYPPRRFEGEDVLLINVMGLVVESKRKF